MRTIIEIILVLLFLSVPITAQELVTRDDFICYDTTDENDDWTGWPSIAINADGSLNQLNVVGAPLPCYNDCSKLCYNRFDKYGNQISPVIHILPDTISLDSIWHPASYTYIYCNDDYVYIPYHVDMNDQPEDKQFLIYFDRNQDYTYERVCVDCDLEYLDYAGLLSTGAINEDGRAISTWSGAPEANAWADSVYLKYYDIPSQTLSPMITPSKVKAPPDQSGYGTGKRYTVNGNPAAAVADNGCFVSVWAGANAKFSHIFYVLYDSLGTAQFDTIRIVDCDIGFMPPGYCRADYNNYPDIAMEPDGDFYITWSGLAFQSDGYFSYDYDLRVYIRGFNADGTPKFDPVCVTDLDSLYLWGPLIEPVISCDSIGNILVSWSDSRFYPESHSQYMKMDVFAQRVDANGNLIGPNFRINNIDGNAGLFGVHHENDMNNEGQAVIIWHYDRNDYEIWAQLMPYEDIGHFVPGDIDYDLHVSISDLTKLVEYMFWEGKNTFWPRDLIDFNDDGKNGTLSDLVYLVEYLFLNGPQPRTPDSGIRPEFEW